MVCKTSILVENSQKDVTRFDSNVDGEYKLHYSKNYQETYKAIDKDEYIYFAGDHWYIGNQVQLNSFAQGWFRSVNENLNGTWAVPQFGGYKNLPDMTVKCAKPINGAWRAWAEWSECSETCSEGVQKRSRKCDNPKPQYGGVECECSSEDVRMCKLEDCNTKAQYFGIGAGTAAGTCLLLFIIGFILCRKRSKVRKLDVPTLEIPTNGNVMYDDVMEMGRRESLVPSIDEYNQVSDHFMMGEATREEAEEVLKKSKIGEFRFRESKGKTILSVVGKNNAIRHIVLKEVNGQFTGDSYNYFNSLRELSTFYNQNFIPGYKVKLKSV